MPILRFPNLEKIRKHVVKEANFNRMEALWEDKKSSIPEVVSCHDQYFTWTIPAIKEERYMRRVNEKLRTSIRMMKERLNI